MQPIIFPIRINRYLSLRGIATRRDADTLISKQCIRINGNIAILGDIVHQHDEVTIKTSQKDKKSLIYVAYHKPTGIISHTAQKGEKSIADSIGNQIYFPVGRLDKASSGLIILTNDGRITDRLLNPQYNHEKEYIVTVDKKITPHVLRILRQGVLIEGYRTKPSRTLFVNDHIFRIVLHEGKKHQIRRMLAALGMHVISLKRIRIMNIHLGNMKVGEIRKITGENLQKFLETLGLA